MEDKNIEKLLELCGCKTIEDLWNYIGYLQEVQSDYDWLKSRINYLHSEMQKLY